MRARAPSHPSAGEELLSAKVCFLNTLPYTPFDIRVAGSTLEFLVFVLKPTLL